MLFVTINYKDSSVTNVKGGTNDGRIYWYW